MATNTEKLGLKKPTQDDFYNIDVFNENFQKIDDFAKRTDNPHGVTASQVGALPLTGGRLTGDLRMGKSAPRIQLNDTANSRYGVFEIGAAGYVSIGNWKNDSDQHNLQIRQPSDGLAEALRLTVNGTKSYRILGEHNISELGVAKFASGSYVGTGTYGEANPISIVVPFKPKLMIIGSELNGTPSIYSESWFTSEYVYSVAQDEHIKYNNGVISIYAHGSTSGASTQHNAEGKTYRWYIFG